jgi:hypothetical protein
MCCTCTCCDVAAVVVGCLCYDPDTDKVEKFTLFFKVPNLFSFLKLDGKSCLFQVFHDI